MKSIMQGKKECFLCRIEASEKGYFGELSDKGLHRHHVIFGRGYRSLSEKWGLWIYLCYHHHTEPGDASPHYNKAVDNMLRKEAQRRFLTKESQEKWMEIFGKNYLSEDEIKRITTKGGSQTITRNVEKKGIYGAKDNEFRIETKEVPSGFFFLD